MSERNEVVQLPDQGVHIGYFENCGDMPLGNHDGGRSKTQNCDHCERNIVNKDSDQRRKAMLLPLWEHKGS